MLDCFGGAGQEGPRLHVPQQHLKATKVLSFTGFNLLQCDALLSIASRHVVYCSLNHLARGVSQNLMQSSMNSVFVTVVA